MVTKSERREQEVSPVPYQMIGLSGEVECCKLLRNVKVIVLYDLYYTGKSEMHHFSRALYVLRLFHYLIYPG